MTNENDEVSSRLEHYNDVDLCPNCNRHSVWSRTHYICSMCKDDIFDCQCEFKEEEE